MRRRGLWVALIAAVLVVGVFKGPSMADRLRHPRDVDGFQDYVVTYMLHPGTQADKDWAIDHPDAVLAEGDRACDWLSNRSSAPDVDPSGDSDVSHLATVYVKQAGGGSSVLLTHEGHRTLVVGAWEFLCQWERDDKTAPISSYED